MNRHGREVEGVVALHAGSNAYDERFGLVPSRVGLYDSATLIIGEEE